MGEDKSEAGTNESEHRDPEAEAMISNARRRHGSFGAVLAAGMLGLDNVLGRKPREEAPIVVDASGEPTDIDSDGIVVPISDESSVVAPPQPRADPFDIPRRKRKRKPS